MIYHIIDINNNKIILSNEENIIDILYNKIGIIDKDKYDKKEIKDIKKNISQIETCIPLFDIYSQNLYLIKPENIYSRVINSHYRLPDKNIINKLKKTLVILEKTKSNINTYYIEKLNKNIRFLSNFNLKILYNTYIKLFYLNQPHTKDLTNCFKPSFIAFLTSKPYYTKSELINLALNMNLKIDINNIETKDICKLVSNNDINSKIILQHQIFIEENIAKSYIQLYTLLGSFYWNFYLRTKCIKDIFLEKQINNLYEIISKSPEFDKDYYLYRFISDDSYLTHLKIGDIFEEKSFISTTRNPFYDTQNNYFGFILLKIKIPKNIEGIGLSIESYSLFPEEEEILLNPARLKLISINDNFFYYHPNIKASKRIKKKYEFELIETIKTSPTANLNYQIQYNIIPKIDFLEMTLPSNDFKTRVYYFYHSLLPSYNNKRYFYTDIQDKEYLFQAFYLDNNPIYEKYFFIQHKDKKNEIYFILQDENTGQIILFIEIRDIISVNYIQKYLGTKNIFSDEELIKFLSSLGYYFGITDIIIHNSYQSYSEISKGLLKDNIDNIIELSQYNPDNHIISLYSGDFTYYNEDLINFMNLKFDKYKNIPGIICNLKKHHILSLQKINVIDLFKNIEKNPLYNILLKTKKTYNLLDFYLFIHYNYFYLLPELCNLIAIFNNDIFTDINSNPWINSFYTLNSQQYLFESLLIPSIKTFNTNIYQDYIHKLSIENKNISFNKYRLSNLRTL